MHAKPRRSSRITLCLLAAALLAIIAGNLPVEAHHAFGAEFDPNRPVLLRGPIVRVEWVNPHTWIHLEVTNDDGTTEVWMVEGGTPNTLLRRGLRRDYVQPGTVVVVDGYQRQGPHGPGQRPRPDVRGRSQVLHGLVRHRRAVRQRAAAAVGELRGRAAVVFRGGTREHRHVRADCVRAPPPTHPTVVGASRRPHATSPLSRTFRLSCPRAPATRADRRRRLDRLAVFSVHGGLVYRRPRRRERTTAANRRAFPRRHRSERHATGGAAHVKRLHVPGGYVPAPGRTALVGAPRTRRCSTRFVPAPAPWRARCPFSRSGPARRSGACSRALPPPRSRSSLLPPSRPGGSRPGVLGRASSAFHAPPSVVIDQRHVNCLAVSEAKDDAPVAGNPHAPLPAAVTRQRMQPVARQVHVSGLNR